jgi:hypothetical protein
MIVCCMRRVNLFWNVVVVSFAQFRRARPHVIPAEAGTQCVRRSVPEFADWIPASAGMTCGPWPRIVQMTPRPGMLRTGRDYATRMVANVLLRE